MRVCPQCGFNDPPMWITTPYRVHCDYCRIEDFEQYYPEIKLEKGERKADGLCAYKRSKTGKYVERQYLRDNPDALTNWVPDYEPNRPKNKKPKPFIGQKRKDKTQTKLLSVVSNSNAVNRH